MADPNDLYPAGPDDVPGDLAAPTSSYKRSTWLAFGGLLGFVLLYLGLTAYFGWLFVRLARDAIHGNASFLAGVLSIAPLFFFLFLVRGLFIGKGKADPMSVEVREEDEPALFAFVRRIADETGAPRPHRVFLSPRVNAAVFYDLSFWNLLFPSKKNLEIGLGLVNALTLDELKAVIAHEFGHFGQRTMAIGRWVYTAQQIAGHIIATRSWLDKVLAFVSHIDLRIAWIGWIMRLFVWAIRAVLDTAFRIIVLADRALTREMELQADLVSVSVSGSDSLIHALHRLGPADLAWDRALGYAGAAADRKAPVADLFAVQTRVLERLREVLDDETLGHTPELPEVGREAHRIFQAELAQPPRMWSTHPPNGEREDNAKRRYFPSHLDARPAWALFRDPDATRRQVTGHFTEAAFGAVEGQPAPIEETLAAVEEDYARPILARRYRGAYLGRSVVAAVAEVEDLYDPVIDEGRTEILQRLDALYPESLSGELERAADLRRELSLLTALQDGVLSAPGGVIRYRGEEIPRARLAEVIERVRREHTEADDAVLAHDRRVRTAHRIAARHLSAAWERYLLGLTSLLHYADHQVANLGDAVDYMHHVLAIVTADGRVSNSERTRLIAACSEVWSALNEGYERRAQIDLPDAVKAKLKVERFDELLPGEFALGPATPQNLGDWLDAVGSWVGVSTDAYGALVTAALETLLEAEEEVARAVREGGDPPLAPVRGGSPEQYTTLVLGQERERQKKLGWWDRFQLADGFLPGAARFTVAAGLLVPAMLFTGAAGSATVSVYNGLGAPVEVSIDGASITVPAREWRPVEVSTDERMEVVARVGEHEVERFEANADSAWVDYVYNVASASPLVEWSAAYGTAQERPESRLGTPRWMRTAADAIFVPPPTSVSLSRRSSGTTREVLSGMAELAPSAQVELVSVPTERVALIETHLRWDASDDPHLLGWLRLQSDPEAQLALVQERLEREPGRVIWSRLEQDLAGPARETVCARHRASAAADPSDADLAYLSIRCLEDPAAREAAFLEAHARRPEHPWLAMAAGYAHAAAARWDEALPLLERARTDEVAPFFDDIALDIARIRRLRAPDPDHTSYTSLLPASRTLWAMLVMEGLLVTEDPVSERTAEAWRHLAKGELEEAWAAATSVPESADSRAHILRLIAASDGAPPAFIEQAWALAPEAGVDGGTVWSTLALARREGRDPTPFIEQARELGGDRAEPLLTLLDLDRLRDDPHGLMAEATARIPPALRGQASMMGTILLGDAAPPEWRRNARALLFIRARPFVGTGG